MASRLLLIEESSAERSTREEELRSAGFSVAVVDAADLYWPKLVEAGGWRAIVFHQSSFSMVFVELASESGIADTTEPVILLTDRKIASEALPTTFRNSPQCADTGSLIDLIKEI